MRSLMTEILHIFILATMGGFVVLLMSAIMGDMSVWSKRYVPNRRNRRINQNQLR